MSDGQLAGLTEQIAALRRELAEVRELLDKKMENEADLTEWRFPETLPLYRENQCALGG